MLRYLKRKKEVHYLYQKLKSSLLYDKFSLLRRESKKLKNFEYSRYNQNVQQSVNK